MVLKSNLTKEHIDELKLITKTSPTIIEKTMFAFYLLQCLKQTGLEFIFKGGTSLMLLLKEPKRFSIDIDIVVKPNILIDNYIKDIKDFDPFVCFEEDKRNAPSDIVKRHFMFFYISPLTGEKDYILLDILFENNSYTTLLEKDIQSSLLITDNNPCFIKIPNANCILGDKLTAFAPHTIGKKLGGRKNLEVLKQMIDCYTLIQEMTDFTEVVKTYNTISKCEMDYRKNNNETIRKEDAIKDTIKSCICIIYRGSKNKGEYSNYKDGIDRLNKHMINETLNGTKVAYYACEILYLCSLLLLNADSYKKIANPDDYFNYQLLFENSKQLSSIKWESKIAYAYLVESYKILGDSYFVI